MKWDILRGVGGQFEIGRVWLSCGTLFALLTPVIFEAYEIGWNGGHFDVTAWCLAYPGGLAALNALGVFAIGNKEKAVASAQATVAATQEKTNASAAALSI